MKTKKRAKVIQIVKQTGRPDRVKFEQPGQTINAPEKVNMKELRRLYKIPKRVSVPKMPRITPKMPKLQ